ncbi:uncharacterized protein LOC143251716 [Tachypleus tridentatus]|uniref:uncharacterized protein LOC143251716 n=1 Tax=Tachypleus tridentatus TaxID=6853 RepID=UPI003FD0F8F8
MSVGLPCDHHEQCIAFDTNSNCVEKTGSLDRVCHCRLGYKSEQSAIDHLKRCVEDPVEQTDPMSLRFGEGSILPIVLSVLAAVLVLFALACGIFHLFKWRTNDAPVGLWYVYERPTLKEILGSILRGRQKQDSSLRILG